jgi:hypothetical protein
MRTKSEWTGVLVRLPVALKGAIVAEVELQGTNVNDLIVGTLAHRFGMSFNPSERCCHTASAEKTKVLLRMSPRLKRKIQHHALPMTSRRVVRKKAASMLTELRGTEAIPLLEAALPQLRLRERIRVKRVIRRLRRVQATAD